MRSLARGCSSKARRRESATKFKRAGLTAKVATVPRAQLLRPQNVFGFSSNQRRISSQMGHQTVGSKRKPISSPDPAISDKFQPPLRTIAPKGPWRWSGSHPVRTVEPPERRSRHESKVRIPTLPDLLVPENATPLGRRETLFSSRLRLKYRCRSDFSRSLCRWRAMRRSGERGEEIGYFLQNLRFGHRQFQKRLARSFIAGDQRRGSLGGRLV